MIHLWWIFLFLFAEENLHVLGAAIWYIFHNSPAWQAELWEQCIQRGISLEELLFRRRTIETTDQLERLGLSEEQVRTHYNNLLAEDLMAPETWKRPAKTRHVEASGFRRFLLAHGPSMSDSMRATLKRTLPKSGESPPAKRLKTEAHGTSVPATIKPTFPSLESQRAHNVYAQAVEVIQGLLNQQKEEPAVPAQGPEGVQPGAGGASGDTCVTTAPLAIPAVLLDIPKALERQVEMVRQEMDPAYRRTRKKAKQLVTVRADHRYVPRTQTSPTKGGERRPPPGQRFDLFQIVPAVRRGGREDPHAPRFSEQGRLAYERIANVAHEIALEETRRREERNLAVQAAHESRKPALPEKESTVPVTTLEGGAPYYWRADVGYTVRDPADSRRVVSTRMNIRTDETEREGHRRTLEKKA